MDVGGACLHLLVRHVAVGTLVVMTTMVLTVVTWAMMITTCGVALAVAVMHAAMPMCMVALGMTRVLVVVGVVVAAARGGMCMGFCGHRTGSAGGVHGPGRQGAGTPRVAPQERHGAVGWVAPARVLAAIEAGGMAHGHGRSHCRVRLSPCRLLPRQAARALLGSRGRGRRQQALACCGQPMGLVLRPEFR